MEIFFFSRQSRITRTIWWRRNHSGLLIHKLARPPLCSGLTSFAAGGALVIDPSSTPFRRALPPTLSQAFHGSLYYTICSNNVITLYTYKQYCSCLVWLWWKAHSTWTRFASSSIVIGSQADYIHSRIEPNQVILL